MPRPTLPYLTSLGTLGPPLELNVRFCRFEQCLTAEQEPVMAGPPVGQRGLRVKCVKHENLLRFKKTGNLILDVIIVQK